MISLQSGKDMAEQNQILIGAIRKLALAGEQAGFSVEEMIELLKTGASVETLLDLLSCTDRHIDFGAKFGEVKDGHRLLPAVQESPSGSSLRLRRKRRMRRDD
jgi:hypothetical protein